MAYRNPLWGSTPESGLSRRFNQTQTPQEAPENALDKSMRRSLIVESVGPLQQIHIGRNSSVRRSENFSQSKQILPEDQQLSVSASQASRAPKKSLTSLLQESQTPPLNIQSGVQDLGDYFNKEVLTPVKEATTFLGHQKLKRSLKPAPFQYQLSNVHMLLGHTESLIQNKNALKKSLYRTGYYQKQHEH